MNDHKSLRRYAFDIKLTFFNSQEKNILLTVTDLCFKIFFSFVIHHSLLVFLGDKK